jgi:ferredoxin
MTTTPSFVFSTYVITEPCVGVKDATCVEVCPVDCIFSKPDEDQFYIDPLVCIACEQCVLVCPVDAIFLDNQVPAQWGSYTEKNADFYRRTKDELTTVPSETAEQMIQASYARAAELGVAISVAVVDMAGVLITSGSMDGAGAESIETALNKAYTAALFQKPTHQLGRNAAQNAPAGADETRLVTVEGGAPILVGPSLLGAVAVSGGAPDQDQTCVQAALTVVIPK